MHFLDHSLLVRRGKQNAAEVGEFLLALVADGFDGHAESIARVQKDFCTR